MSRDEYLNILHANLRNVPPQEVGNIMQYYFEYFEEAGPENVQKVIEELGPPHQLANRVSADYVIRGMENGTAGQGVRQKASNAWLIVLAICGSPVWLPLALALIIVIAAVVLSIFIIIISFSAASIAIMVAGLFTSGIGIVTVFSHVPTGIFMMGSGLICAGVGILIFIGMFQLARLLKKALFAIMKACVRKGAN